jgi:vacuolar iron transporter family protein
MKKAIKKGFSFGLTSGIITTLGLVVGLGASTHSKLAVIAGIITIAVADSLSDAMGIHISEEADGKKNHNEVWVATGVTFITKLVFALTFLVPILLLTLDTAIIVSIAWGLILIAGFSFYIAWREKQKPWQTVSEHLILTIFVIVATKYIGTMIDRWLM